MDNSIKDKIANFFNAYPLKHFQKGQVIIYANEEPVGIFRLVSGEVRQYTITSSGDEIVLNVYKTPAFFPANWAINGSPNKYFFDTVSDATIQIAPPDEVVTFLHENPEVTYDLLGRVFSGLDGVLERMTYLMSGSAQTRTLFEIIVSCRRFGIKQGDKYILKLHEAELAARAGLSRETVSRVLAQLKKDGLLGVSHTQITINDLAELEQELNTSLAR